MASTIHRAAMRGAADTGGGWEPWFAWYPVWLPWAGRWAFRERLEWRRAAWEGGLGAVEYRFVSYPCRAWDGPCFFPRCSCALARDVPDDGRGPR